MVFQVTPRFFCSNKPRRSWNLFNGQVSSACGHMVSKRPLGLQPMGLGFFIHIPGCETSSPPGWHGPFRGLSFGTDLHHLRGWSGTSKCKKRREPKATQNGSIFGFTSINLGLFGGFWRLIILNYNHVYIQLWLRYLYCPLIIYCLKQKPIFFKCWSIMYMTPKKN